MAALVAVLCVVPHALGDEAVSFKADVRQVLRTHCVGCHNPNRAEADLDLSDFRTVIEGSYSGEVVVAGKPDESLLYLVTAHLEEPAMPPGGRKIPAEDLDLMRRWIEGGLLEEPSSAPGPTKSTTKVVEPAPEPSVTPSPDLVFRGVHASPVIALDACGAAGLVALGGQMQVILLDADSLTLNQVLPYPEGEPQSLRFSHDGALLIAGGGEHAQSGGVVVWDVATGGRVAQSMEDFDVALAADLSPDGRLAISGGPEKRLKVLALPRCEPLHVLDKHTDWVLDARFSPEGLLLASADRDGAVYVWETESGKTLHTLRGHQDAVTGVAWLDGGDTLTTVSEDGSLRQWNMHTGKQTERWSAHPDGVLDLVATSGGQLATAGRDRRVRIWETDGELVHESNQFESLPTTLACLGEGRLVIGGQRGEVVRWDTEKSHMVALVLSDEQTTSTLAAILPPDPSVLAPKPSQQPAASMVSLAPASEVNGLLSATQLLETRLLGVSQESSDLLEETVALKRRIRLVHDELDELTLKSRGDPELLAELRQALESKDVERSSIQKTLEQLRATGQSMQETQERLAGLPDHAQERVQQAMLLQDIASEKLGLAMGQAEQTLAECEAALKELRGRLSEAGGVDFDKHRKAIDTKQRELLAYEEELATLLQRTASLLQAKDGQAQMAP